MTNIFKIQCLIVDDEPMAREIMVTHLSKFSQIQVVGQCGSAVEAFQYINNHDINLLFLDINMPEITGISFAKSINKNIKVIFTTAYRDYAVEGFELRAVDYLLKPISFSRLEDAINRYLELSQPKTQTQQPQLDATDFMFVRANRQMLKVDFDDIHYIESYSDYIKIHCNKQTIVTRETISSVEAKLPSQAFMRIHRSFIVAIKHISSFTNEQILMSKTSLPISRSYKKEVLKRLEQF